MRLHEDEIIDRPDPALEAHREALSRFAEQARHYAPWADVRVAHNGLSVTVSGRAQDRAVFAHVSREGRVSFSRLEGLSGEQALNVLYALGVGK